MASLIAASGSHAIHVVKMVLGLVTGLGARALDRHPSLVAWLAVAGFVGAVTELSALV